MNEATHTVCPSLTKGKIYFGRSAVKEVTDERVPALNDFLKVLFPA